LRFALLAKLKANDEDLKVYQSIADNYFKDATPQPAQKPWVGLTDEEIDYQAKKDDHAVYFALGALWAEAKLKEKNNG